MTPAAPHSDSLRADARGATMLIGLFMAVVAVGFLYYLIGIGDAILVREKMQDAADASAFSGAIIHARGMNILALLNIIMASVLAILVMLKLISAASTAAIAVLIGIAWLFPPVLVAVPPLRTIATTSDRVANRIRPTVMTTLAAINKLAGGVSRVVPLAATVKVVDFATNTYSPPARFGFIFPIYSRLPVVDDRFERLCEEAGVLAGQAIAFPIKKIGGTAGARVAGLISSFTGGMAERFAGYFCGQGGAPPQIPYEKETFLPLLETDASRDCAKDPPDASACDTAITEIENARAAFDGAAGVCDGPDKAVCDDLLQKARTVCRPGRPHLEKWWYRTETFERVWRVVTDEQTQTRSLELVDAGRPVQPPEFEMKGDSKGTGNEPCIPDLLHDPPWVTSPMTEPVCQERVRTPTMVEVTAELALRSDDDPHITREFSVTTDILGCLQVTEEHLELTTDPLGAGGSNEAPKGMCNCAELGEDRFQIKAFIIGDTEAFLRRAEHGVKVANFGRDPGEEVNALVRLTRKLGDVSFAQAEYFYDGSEDREEWLWNMYWKARMRRFRIGGSGWTCPKSDDNCPDPLISVCGQACSRGLSAVGAIGKLILH